MIALGPVPSRTGPQRQRPAAGWRPVAEGVSVIALEWPSLWLIALAGFLTRGGLIVFVLPIVVLPSAVGLANFIGPTAVTAAGPSGRLIELLAAAVGFAAVWLVVGGVLGSVVDRSVILAHLEAIGAPVTERPSYRRSGGLWDLVAIRLLLVVPLGLAVAWASGRIVDAGYQELILPSNLATPLLLRVLLRTLDSLALLAVVWLVSESFGAMAIRRSVIDGAAPVAALRGAFVHAVRHPVSTLATAVVSISVSVAFLVPALAALSLSWTTLRVALVQGGSPVGAVLALAAFMAIWSAGLVLAGGLSAWRSALWTGEMVRFDIARSGDRYAGAEAGKL